MGRQVGAQCIVSHHDLTRANIFDLCELMLRSDACALAIRN